MAETLIHERPDGVRILRLDTPEDAVPYRASFVGAYQDIFSEPPYNERLFPSEAEGVLRAHLQADDGIVVLAVRGRFSVVGFGVTVPLRTRPDIMRELRGLVRVAHTHYFADMGVLSSWRHTGLGAELIDVRLKLIDKRRFTHVVLRCSAQRNASYEMYLRRGFDDMGVYMEVPARRQDGLVSTDRRLFLSKVLPSPDDGADDESTGDPDTWIDERRPG